MSSSLQLDEIQWRAPEWIQAFGLRTDNVLEYFSLSPFYDRSSNNQVLKMQSVYNEQMHQRDLSKELVGMKGIEFVIAYAQEPDLWVIRKQERSSPTDAEILATYFVVGDNIYQSPSVYSVVSSRLLSTSLDLAKALETAQSLPKFEGTGYKYTTEVKQSGREAEIALAVSMGKPNYLK